jgi:hypothetical protein
MMGTYKFMMGTYKFILGTYKMQVMHKFVLVDLSVVLNYSTWCDLCARARAIHI